MAGDDGATPLIQAEGLGKTYPPRDRRGTGFRAVAGIDFHVDRGRAPSGSSAPTGRASPRRCACSAASPRPPRGSLRILGVDRDGGSVRVPSEVQFRIAC